MKKAAIAASVLFFLAIPGNTFALDGEDHTLAQTETTPEEEQAMEEASDELIEISTPSATTEEEEENVNYILPYPGILPDHPLYFLKKFRDSIVGMLISDPVKKAEFSLLNSNKQLASARMLTADGKQEHTRKALESAQKYMKQTVAEIKNARMQKKEYRTLLDQTRTALRKHEVVAEDLLPTLENEAAEKARDYAEFAQSTREEVDRIK